MSIISGFIAGSAKGITQASSMLLKDTLEKERREADFLRQEQLSKKQQTFQTSERLAGEEFKSGETTKLIESREKIAAAKTPKPQLIKYTDSKGYEQEGILQKNKNGTFTIVRPDTGEAMESEITREELKNKAAQMNVANTDRWLPWDEFDPKDPEVRAAVVKEREGGKGIIGSQIETEKPAASTMTKTAPQTALDYVKSNPDALPDFIKKYGYDPTK